jgi:hypothetical protein
VLAKALGLANTAARPRRIHPFNDQSDPQDPALRAIGAELDRPEHVWQSVSRRSGAKVKVFHRAVAS